MEMLTLVVPNSPFYLHFFETEGNGHLYGSTERNHCIQTGPKDLLPQRVSPVSSDKDATSFTPCGWLARVLFGTV